MRGAGLPVQQQPRPVPGQQPHRHLPVPRRLRMPDRLHRESVVRQPPRGRPVQPGNLTRRGTPQLQPQKVSEQPVVAEPRPRRVQRHHERVGLLQLLQHPLPAAPPGQQVRQLPVDPVQHAGHQQQPPHPLALPLQHLGHQVFGHRPLTAGKLRREPPRILAPGQRQRRQPQPRRPPLGPPVQHPQRRIRQLNPRRPEQLPRLGQAEPQIPPADLGQLPLQPQPVQPQPHPLPGRQHHPQLLRTPQQQQLQLAPRLRRPQLVHVIDHQPDPLIQPRQVLQQPLHHRPPVQLRRRRQRPHQPRPREQSRAARPPPTARTAAHHAPPPPPAPRPPAPPGPPPRSTTAARPSSRSPPAPTPPPPAPPPPAARTTPAGTPHPPHQGEPPGHPQNPIPQQAPPPDHRASYDPDLSGEAAIHQARDGPPARARRPTAATTAVRHPAPGAHHRSRSRASSPGSV